MLPSRMFFMILRNISIIGFSNVASLAFVSLSSHFPVVNVFPILTSSTLSLSPMQSASRHTYLSADRLIYSVTVIRTLRENILHYRRKIVTKGFYRSCLKRRILKKKRDLSSLWSRLLPRENVNYVLYTKRQFECALLHALI